MNIPVRYKNAAFAIYDLLTCIATFLSAVQMWIIRRYGVRNFPLARQILLKMGVFPIVRHFYEPLFHTADLTKPVEQRRKLPGIRFEVDEQLRLLQTFHFADEINRLFAEPSPVAFSGHQFSIGNMAFGPGDVDLYYSVIRHFKPKRIVEIGSGYSTMVALQAIIENERKTSRSECELVAIEPYPWFRHERLNLVPKKVEDVDFSIFQELKKNDVLFIDSSHMIRPQGDVLFEILEILPSLQPGVIVHVHDVFSPKDYPRRWIEQEHKFWNEQYLLEAFLSCNDRFRILLAPNLLALEHPAELKGKCPLLAKAGGDCNSFWIQRV